MTINLTINCDTGQYSQFLRCFLMHWLGFDSILFSWKNGITLQARRLVERRKAKMIQPILPSQSLTSALQRYTLQYIEISFRSSESVCKISRDREVVFNAEVNDLSPPAHTFSGSLTPLSTIPVHTNQFGLDLAQEQQKIFSFQKLKLRNGRHRCCTSRRIPVPHGQIHRYG